MPEHLQVYQLAEGVKKNVEDLGEWLKRNGTFERANEPYFERCTSTSLLEHVGPLWNDITTLFNQNRSRDDVRNNAGYRLTLTKSTVATSVLGSSQSTEWRRLDDEQQRTAASCATLAYY